MTGLGLFSRAGTSELVTSNGAVHNSEITLATFAYYCLCVSSSAVLSSLKYKAEAMMLVPSWHEEVSS